jgi:hypothetical protein
VSFIDGGDDGAVVTIDEVGSDSVALRRPALVGTHGFELSVGELRLVLEARQRKAWCRHSLSQWRSSISKTVTRVRVAGLMASDSADCLVNLLCQRAR